MLAAGKKPRLPREYQEVEWIGSPDQQSATQCYILTFVPFAYISKIIVDYGVYIPFYVINPPPHTGVTAPIFVTSHNNQGNLNTNAYVATDRFAGFLSSTPSIPINSNGGTMSKIEFEITPNVNQNGNLRIGSWSDIYWSAAGRYYRFITYNGNNVLTNYVPCYRKSDNKPGMYDLCGSICRLTNSPFYINAGTGEFLVGPDVN